MKSLAKLGIVLILAYILGQVYYEPGMGVLFVAFVLAFVAGYFAGVWRSARTKRQRIPPQPRPKSKPKPDKKPRPEDVGDETAILGNKERNW